MTAEKLAEKRPFRIWWLRSGGCYCHSCGQCTHMARWRFPTQHSMSCDACLTCTNSARLWEPRYMPMLGTFTTPEHFRLSDWWHFRWWIHGLVQVTAYRLIAPKDPKVKGAK